MNYFHETDKSQSLLIADFPFVPKNRLVSIGTPLKSEESYVELRLMARTFGCARTASVTT